MILINILKNAKHLVFSLFLALFLLKYILPFTSYNLLLLTLIFDYFFLGINQEVFSILYTHPKPIQ